MKVSFYVTKRMEAEVNDDYKVLFDNSTINNLEWEDIYQQLCMDLAEQFDIDEDDYIENVDMEEE